MNTPADIRRNLLDLDDFLHSEEVLNLDIEQLMEHLITINVAKRELADIYDAFSKVVIDRMDKDSIQEISVGNANIQKKISAPRKTWNSKSLIEDTYDRLAQSSTDMDTGELTLSPRELAIKLLDYFNPSYWRVKELSKLGINADNYCEVGEEKTNIAIYMKGTK
jgi:hypothetical protein